jgi:hypothetical protein
MNLGPADDRETNIQWHHDEDTAHVYTCDQRVIRRLRKNPLAVLVETHKDQEGRITGFEFDVPVRAISIKARSTRGRERTPAQLAATARLSSSRRGQSGHPGGGPG